MTKLLLVLAFVISISCNNFNNEKRNNEQTEHNSNQITNLEEKVNELQEELAKGQAKANTNDPNYNKLQERIDELRADLLRYIKQLDTETNNKIAKINTKYDQLKKSIEQSSTETEISALQLDKIKYALEQEYLKKSDLIQLQKEQAQTTQQVQALNQEIAELKSKYAALQKEYKTYLEAALNNWYAKFEQSFAQNQNNLNKALQKEIFDEISRIKTSLDMLERELTHLKNLSVKERAQLKETITDLEQLQKLNEEQLKKIHDNFLTQESNELFASVLGKVFAPCDHGLKNDTFCYTYGTTIVKLGGKFIDPLKFKRDQEDLLSYLSLSGIKNKALLDEPLAYINPSPANMSKFKACHADDGLTGNIAPQEQWPRLVIMGLILQSIENDLLLKKKQKFIGANIFPVKEITSWWRSQCYHNALNGIDSADSKSSQSDHLYGAAVDPIFENHESFVFYRDYIEEKIWNQDIFEIVYPLSTAKIKMSIGIGLGDGKAGKGQMHIGLMSPIQIDIPGGERRVWGYDGYTDLYPRKEKAGE